jgi:HAD superfamily hydrolase (TIGR01549 family)
VRGQIGKGGDKLIPVFLSADEQKDHGKELEEWRGDRFKKEYLPIVRPFSAVPDLLRRVREAGLQIAIASSAKKDEVDKYLDIAGITDLVDLTTSSDDVEQSKPAPDIFEIVLKKLKMESADAVAIGDTPYDAEAAGKAGVPTVGVLCGGFTEDELRKAGCAEVYPGPAALLAVSNVRCCASSQSLLLRSSAIA